MSVPLLQKPDVEGFRFPVARELGRNEPPSAEELKTLRERVDPGKVFLS